MRSQLPACLLVAALAACVTQDEPELGTSSEALAAKCPKLFCGNTPYLGVYPFWELDQTGVTYSSNGLRIAGAVHGGVPQRIRVKGFLWQRLPQNSTTLQPIDNTVLELESDDTTTTYELTITPAPPVPYVEGGADGTLIPTYWIEYVAVVNGRRRPPVKLCGVEPGTSLPRPAIVFAGDRYSSTTGELIATGDAARPWFNITCKDDALWKLALMRHVDAAEDAAHQTSVDQRMALLRSIRADYCGDGTPHTEPGTAIDWINDGGWLTLDTDGGIEAVWGPKGAVCVDQTRLPDAEIDCAGTTPEPPPCAPIFASWTSHGSVLTLVPAVD
jgi:hypothetical protein